MIQCNYLLKWQLSNGEIVKRWANIVSASKYDVGENGNSTIVLSSNNYTILIGYCEEGFELEGKRVFIDLKPVEPTKVFKMTRSDDVLYNSGNIGMLLSFIADKTEFNSDTDNQELRICDYINPIHTLPPSPDFDIMNNLTAVISGNINLRNEYKRTYEVNFTGKDNIYINPRDVDFNWNIVSAFDVPHNIYDNKIDLSVDDEDLIGSSFFLQIIIAGTVYSEIVINIIE